MDNTSFFIYFYFFNLILFLNTQGSQIPSGILIHEEILLI